MKKLIAMIGAVATAFGLYAAAPTTVDPAVGGLSFEADDPGVVEGSSDFDFTAKQSRKLLWLTPGEITGTVKAYEGETAPAHTKGCADYETQLNYLDIETDGAPLFRTFADASNIGTEYEGNPTNYVSAAGVYMDVNVKFTAGEEAPAVGDGTKLAVWAQVIEGDDATTTNLVVTCGQLDDGGVPTPANIVLDTSALTTDLVGAWHRVTILSMVDAQASVTYFLVYVDGKLMSAVDGGYNAFAEGADPETFVSEKNLKYVNGDAKNTGRSLFPSMVKYGTDFSGVLSMVGFQGAGQIDDLWLDVGSPFTMDVQVIGLTNADIVSLKANGDVVEGEAGLYTVPAGATLEIALKAKAGYLFADGTDTATWTGDAADEINLSDDIEDAEKAVAQKGTAIFLTLKEAIDDEAEGTITLLENIVLDDMIEIEKAVTLDLNGKTLTAAGLVSPDDAVVAVKHGGSLTVEDNVGTGAIDGTANGTQYAGVKMTIKGDEVETYDDTNKATLIVNAGTIKGYYYGITGNGSVNRGNCFVTINDGTIEGTAENDNAGIFFPCYGKLAINGGTVKGAMGVYMKSGSAEVSVESGAKIIGNGAQAAFVGKRDGFYNTGDAFVCDNAGYPGGAPAPAIAGGTFESENGKAVASYAQGTNEPVAGFITGGTFNAALDAALINENCWAKQDESGKWVVEAKGAFAIILAGATDPIYRDTLAEAVAAANAGATITVIADATVVDWVRVDKEITLDLNGKTIAADVDNWTKGSDAVIAVGRGGKLTIDDAVGTGVIDSKTIMCAVKMTQTGALDTENPYAATPTAQLIVNGGNLKGYEYGISGNGNAGRGNTAVTINGGVIEATATASNVAPKVNSIGIYNPQKGTLTVNGGTIKGNMGIYVKSGDVITEFTDGLVLGNGAYGDYGVNDNGADNTGVALAIDNANYPGGVPTANIKGGKFESLNNVAIASYARTDGEEVANFISGGQFKSATGKTMSDALLASGFAYGTPGEDGWVSVAQSAQDPIATVAGVTYTDLHKAMEAVTNGETLELLCDVDLTGIDWVPVLNFKGVFNGHGHTIKNMTVNNPTVNGNAMIANIAGSTVISNVTFESANVTGNVLVGVIVGCAQPTVAQAENIAEASLTGYYLLIADTVVSNCVVTGNKNVGGMVGHDYSDLNFKNVKVVDCELTIPGTGSKTIGGLFGYTQGASVDTCLIKGNTITSPLYVGAICGRPNGGVNVNNAVIDQPNVPMVGELRNTVTMFGDETDVVVSKFFESQDGLPAIVVQAGSYNLDPTDYLVAGKKAVLDTTTGMWTVEDLAKVQLTITANESVVTGINDGEVTENDVLSFTVKPNDTYKVTKVEANNEELKDDQGTYTFTVGTVDVAIVVTTEKDAQPVDPEEPKQYDDAEKAKAAADAINAAKETMINTPTGAVAADYTKLFTAVVTADNKVVVELNENGTNTLQQSANELAEAVAGLGDSTADSVTVTVTDAMIAADAIVPGFYYGLGASTTVDGEKVVGEGQWKQATTAGIDGGLTAAKPSADKGFFQVKVSVKNPAE